jgi:hypothetical protein
MTFENQIFCAKLFYITRKYLIGIFNEYQLLLLSAYKLNNLHFNADLQKSKILIKITGYLKNIDSVSCISKLMGDKGGIYYLNSRISDQGG